VSRLADFGMNWAPKKIKLVAILFADLRENGLETVGKVKKGGFMERGYGDGVSERGECLMISGKILKSIPEYSGLKTFLQEVLSPNDECSQHAIIC